jgi:hypothetical protein
MPVMDWMHVRMMSTFFPPCFFPSDQEKKCLQENQKNPVEKKNAHVHFDANVIGCFDASRKVDFEAPLCPPPVHCHGGFESHLWSEGMFCGKEARSSDVQGSAQASEIASERIRRRAGKV